VAGGLFAIIFLPCGIKRIAAAIPNAPSFVLKQKKQKFKRWIARRPASFQGRNQKNSPAAQTAFDFLRPFQTAGTRLRNQSAASRRKFMRNSTKVSA